MWCKANLSEITITKSPLFVPFEEVCWNSVRPRGFIVSVHACAILSFYNTSPVIKINHRARSICKRNDTRVCKQRIELFWVRVLICLHACALKIDTIMQRVAPGMSAACLKLDLLLRWKSRRKHLWSASAARKNYFLRSRSCISWPRAQVNQIIIEKYNCSLYCFCYITEF